MKSDSDQKFPPVRVGASVRVLIPEVNKGRGDLRNMSVTEVGTTNGLLKQLHARSQFTV